MPYRSTNEMVLNVVGGQTLFAFPDSGIVVPMAQGGKVRALAVGSSGPAFRNCLTRRPWPRPDAPTST